MFPKRPYIVIEGFIDTISGTSFKFFLEKSKDLLKIKVLSTLLHCTHTICKSLIIILCIM